MSHIDEEQVRKHLRVEELIPAMKARIAFLLAR
jgi:hypothetical protein